MVYYDTPKLVVINEAVELSKMYSDDKVVKLINAVLDKIRDNEETHE
jgi:transcription termination factor NusB